MTNPASQFQSGICKNFNHPEGKKESYGEIMQSGFI